MIIIIIIIAGILLSTIFLAFQSKPTQRSSNKNEKIFSDAWKRIGGGKIDKRANVFRSGKQRLPGQYHDHDFLTDLLLRTFKSRRHYYRDVYLNSAAWQRKRFVVLKRDNWICVHCGRPATQVHHKKYAKKIGNEPIDWLESVCSNCHDHLHQ